MIELIIKGPIKWWYVGPIIFGLVCFLAAIFGAEWFREFMFVSMFGGDEKEAPPFAAIFTPVVIIISAYMLIKRTNIMVGQFELNTKSAEIDRFTDAVKNLDISSTPTIWQSSIKTIDFMARQNPQEFVNDAISAFLMFGQELGFKNHQTQTKDKKIVRQYEKVTYIILKKIFKLAENDNINNHISTAIMIEDFIISKKLAIAKAGKAATIYKQEYCREMIFINCDFQGIVFDQCCFESSAFMNCKNIRMKNCMISEYDKKNIDYIQNLIFNKNFVLIDCFIWGHDVNLPKGKSLPANFKVLKNGSLKHWLKKSPAEKMMNWDKMIIKNKNKK